MKIRHQVYGEVEGVDHYQLSKHWHKTVDGAHMIYYAHDGWSEVTGPQYVDVTGEVGVIEVSEFNTQLCVGPHTLILPKGYRAMIHEWYSLPDTNTEFIFNTLAQIRHSEEIFRYLQKFRKPCITLEKEQS